MRLVWTLFVCFCQSFVVSRVCYDSNPRCVFIYCYPIIMNQNQFHLY